MNATCFARLRSHVERRKERLRQLVGQHLLVEEVDRRHDGSFASESLVQGCRFAHVVLIEAIQPYSVFAPMKPLFR
jgi:hypothetical protein